MSRKRALLASLLALALAGVAAGVLVARDSSASKGATGVLASGNFTPVSWTTRGRATIVRKADGSAVLQLRGFQTQQAPELSVVFEPVQGPTHREHLANLRRASGNQDYDVTSEVSSRLPAKVLVYCTKCGKVWGEATMRPTKLDSQS
jgi:hypothetical protein